MNTYVLDASAGLRLVVTGPETDTVRRIVADADEIVAPNLYAAEVANAIWKLARAGHINDATVRLNTVLELLDEQICSPPDLIAEALTEAIRLNHPVYDLLYAVTARRRGDTLITVDRRLTDLAQTMGVPVLPAAN